MQRNFHAFPIRTRPIRLARPPEIPPAHRLTPHQTRRPRYYVRRAESWTKALGHHSAERTQSYFDAS